MKRMYLHLTCVTIFLLACTPQTDITNNKNSISSELKVSKSIELPDGIELFSIKGIDAPSPVNEINLAALTADIDEEIPSNLFNHPKAVGSGGKWIALNLLFNVNPVSSHNNKLIIPRGTIFECNNNAYNKGIILQDVLVDVPQLSNSENNTTLSVTLFMYCLSNNKKNSCSEVGYNIKGVCECKKLNKLIKTLANKKIDISTFSDHEIIDYIFITSTLQNIVWDIYNGLELNDEDMEFLASLPVNRTKDTDIKLARK